MTPPDPEDPASSSVDKSANGQSFDPYRFGAPEHPVPPEFAPPGYEQTGYRPPSAEPGPAAGDPANPWQVPAASQQYVNPQPPGYPPAGYQPPNPYGYPPPPYQQPHAQYPPYPGTGRSNGKATAGLILGILSIVFCWTFFFDLLLVVPALVFSLLGLGEARRGATGRGAALWGLWLTVAGAILAVAATVVLIVINNSVDCSVTHSPGSFSHQICKARNN